MRNLVRFNLVLFLQSILIGYDFVFADNATRNIIEVEYELNNEITDYISNGELKVFAYINNDGIACEKNVLCCCVRFA